MKLFAVFLFYRDGLLPGLIEIYWLCLHSALSLRNSVCRQKEL